MYAQDNGQLGVDIGGTREILLKERNMLMRCEGIIKLMQNTFKKTIDGVTYRFHSVNLKKPGFMTQVPEKPPVYVPDQEQEEAKVE